MKLKWEPAEDGGECATFGPLVFDVWGDGRDAVLWISDDRPASGYYRNYAKTSSAKRGAQRFVDALCKAAREAEA